MVTSASSGGTSGGWDTPGAVVGGMVELVGQRAGGAEPSGVQVPLVAASRAVELRGFIAGSYGPCRSQGYWEAPRRGDHRGAGGGGLGGRSH